jgi:hypothetical protein
MNGEIAGEVENPGENLAAHSPERRSHPRYVVDEKSSLIFVSTGTAAHGCIESLSLAGCRIRTQGRISASAGSRVELTFKANGIAFRFSGVLAWTDGLRVAGIRFVDMIARRQAALAEVIGELEAAAGAQAVAPPAADNVALPTLVSDESATKPRVLAPEKRIAKPEPPAPVAPVAIGAAQPSVAPVAKPSDRRIHARHEVDTSAVIFLVKIGSSLRGRIVDLSQSGCCIRTNERFPVGIFTRVETEFHLQGLPFRLSGVIQAIHARNIVGIRFLDLSDRKRQQVAELIGEMQEILDAQKAAADTPAEESSEPSEN